MSVASTQRYTQSHRCPICGGAQSDPRKKERRCVGYLSAAGDYARCSREEHAGALQIEDTTQTYAHRLAGACRCGVQHNDGGAAELERPRQGPKIVEGYDYPNEAGAVLSQVVRLDPKSFRQRRPDGKGGWIWGLGDSRRVLYRLPELVAADPAEIVFVVEGEKSVQAVRGLGFVATTNAGGTGGGAQWDDPAYREPLRGRHVVVLPDVDKDGQGRRHAERVARALAGVAASVKIVDLPGLRPTGEDVVDWLAAGGTAEKLRELASAAHGPGPVLIPLACEQANLEWATPLPDPIPSGISPLDGLLDGGFMPESIYYLVARSGVGKSGLAIQVALDMARRGRLVAYFTTELKTRQVLARAAAQVLRRPWKHLWQLPPAMGMPTVSRALQGLTLRVIEVRRKTDIIGELNRLADAYGKAPVLCLDYLQHLVRRENPDERRLATAAWSDQLGEWTRDMKSVGLIVSSTGRQNYSGNEDKAASDFLGTAKESGDVEFDAGGIMFLDTMTDGVAPGSVTTSRLHLAKSRFSVTGTIGLEFDGALGVFRPDPTGALSDLQGEIVEAIRDGKGTTTEVTKVVGRRRADVLTALAALRTRGLVGGKPLRVLSDGERNSSRSGTTVGDENAISPPSGTVPGSVPDGNQDTVSDGENGSGLGNRPWGGGNSSAPVGGEWEPDSTEEVIQ